MDKTNSNVKSSFAEGAGLKKKAKPAPAKQPRTAADPQAPVRAGRKKCPEGQVFKDGRCVPKPRHNPWGEKSKKNPTNSSQTTGP